MGESLIWQSIGHWSMFADPHMMYSLSTIMPLECTYIINVPCFWTKPYKWRQHAHLTLKGSIWSKWFWHTSRYPLLFKKFLTALSALGCAMHNLLRSHINIIQTVKDHACNFLFCRPLFVSCNKLVVTLGTGRDVCRIWELFCVFIMRADQPLLHMPQRYIQVIARSMKV
jgi:hypothetical protein